MCNKIEHQIIKELTRFEDEIIIPIAVKITEFSCSVSKKPPNF
ncbi:hypothetical protein [Winogradskyella sp. PC D3.3]